jgi:DNA (cytosine-5)-methyltransferase 1
MSGRVAERKRLLRVTEGNLRQSHIYINGHLDFFPDDCVGPPRQNSESSQVQIFLSGLEETVATDIGRDAKTGKPRAFLRGRSWVRRFYEHHDIQIGDVLALERLSERKYRLYPFESRSNRLADWREILQQPLPGNGPTVIELFAGCGGMVLGFKQAGFRTLLANEWDAAACETIRKNITSRVAQCAIEEIEEFPKADVVVGGPPCQGFSNLGERVPNDPRRQLWRHFLRAVKDAEPRAFVIENVPPILKSQEYVEIVKYANSLGYQVAGKVLNAADYGVPQLRKRAIIIGVKDGMPSHPDPTHISPAKKGLLTAHLQDWITVREAIGDLPNEPTEKNWHIGRNPTPMSLQRYKCIPAGGNRWNLPPHLMPDCWKRKVSGGTDLFGRLWWDRPSVTIRTEFYKPEKGRYLHPVADRPITHREAARLQGFDDTFEFQGKRIEVGIQIGNAVPPALAEAIARHVKVLLGSSPRRKANGSTP